jgi:hypothetical protein
MRNLLTLGCVLACATLACSDDETNSSSGSPTSTATSGEGGTGGSGGSMGGSGGSAGGAGGMGGCTPSLPLDVAPPETLSATGLYADIGNKTLGAEIQPFTPQYELWTDGADKARWVYLPDCGPIDTSDMDEWSLPVGARLWKEFSLNGARIETRLIERTGSGDNDFIFAAYLWDQAENEAARVPLGVTDAKGTMHDVPDETACRRCHGAVAGGGGKPSRALGFSALQLSHNGAGVTLDSLTQAGQLSVPPSGTYAVPGNSVEQAALGYLHANCGNCHNHSSEGISQVHLHFWLVVGATTVNTSETYLTAVGQANTLFTDQNVTARIEPGDPQASSVWFRMSQRANNAQMPTLGTEVVDATGLAAVEAWIASLP